MNTFLVFQLCLWFVGTVSAAFAVVQYFHFKKKESRLPKACEYDDLAARVELKQRDLVDIDSELLAARKLIGESQQKLAEAAEARKWYETQRHELAKIEGERTQQELLRASIANLHKEQRLADEALNRIRHEHAAESANITNLATQKANLSAEIQKAKEQLAELSKQVQDSTLTLGAITNELNLKKIDLERLNHLLEVTEHLKEKAKAKLDETLGAEDNSRRNLAELDTRRHLLEQESLRLKSEIDNLNRRIKSLESVIQQLEADTARLDPQKRGESRYRELWEPIKFPSLPPANAHVPEREALAQTERYLRSHGLNYPQRVLYAFHTALKTADMSPLVVLAGISGTGKSLLPKRYAEAMGIHTVSLAVQPRWDSPQDLFGFFNHLEGRFKATELARAMVMFERFNRKDWVMPKDWNHGREDRMLLVLLDEMNLARVEYYFSDFLSRLETRRDVREENETDRRKAEIPLEMGSLREDERAISLYPGRNVLFTGTMNEDESTQALSDKVIDRACVLRFGRPKKLERTTARANPMAENLEGLTFAAWRSWGDSKLSGSNERELNDWIARLNSGMDQLGKPFAHRVHQAILSYASNYPQISGVDPIRVALADQIEQRIMPKLRGLELEDSNGGLDAIEKVVEDTNDRALLMAFRQGRESKSGTFLWRGLDRGEE